MVQWRFISQTSAFPNASKTSSICWSRIKHRNFPCLQWNPESLPLPATRWCTLWDRVSTWTDSISWAGELRHLSPCHSWIMHNDSKTWFTGRQGWDVGHRCRENPQLAKETSSMASRSLRFRKSHHPRQFHYSLASFRAQLHHCSITWQWHLVYNNADYKSELWDSLEKEYDHSGRSHSVGVSSRNVTTGAVQSNIRSVAKLAAWSFLLCDSSSFCWSPQVIGYLQKHYY